MARVDCVECHHDGFIDFGLGPIYPACSCRMVGGLQ